MSEAIPLPLILRKEDHVVTAVYDEARATLTEILESTFTGDYSECEVFVSAADPSVVAHASTTALRCCQLIESATAPCGVETKVLFEVAMPHIVVDMRFSPKGTYLVTYAMMDPKRTPDGNLSVFEVATGRLLRRGMQARWPAMEWTSDEAYVVRPVQGWLHVLDGNFDKQVEQPQAEGGEGERSEEKEGDCEQPQPASPTTAVPVTAANAALSKIDLMLASDKDIEYSLSPAEGFPILALFKPFYKNRQGSFSLYRLPSVREDGPLYQLNFGRAESGTVHWSRHTGKHLALLISSQRDPSGKSYYGTVTLHLVDVMARRMVDVKLRGDGETVHDCQWCPTSDELMVVHGRMPHNKATLFNRNAVPLMTFGEGPRNLIHWAPTGNGFVLGGSGNLAGDFQFYSHTAAAVGGGAVGGPTAATAAPGGGRPSALPAQAAAAAAPAPACTGEFNNKCSFQSWAPDSHSFLCSTVFTRLRMDNKLHFVKKNGATVLVERYPILYGAHWVALRDAGAYPVRPVSPRGSTTGGDPPPPPKAAAYKAPGGTSRAAAMLRRPDAASTATAKPSLPVGAGAVVTKKKKKR